MTRCLLFVVCCSLLHLAFSTPNCKGVQYSEILSDDCKTLWICSNGTRQTIECKDDQVIGADHTCVSENSHKFTCVHKRLSRRWGNKRSDCLWMWSEWSAPYGFGSRERTVIVYRYPQNGGTLCPTKQSETKKSAKNEPPSVEVVAKQIVASFLNPSPSFRLTRALEGNDRHKRQVTPNRDLLVILDSSGSIGSSNFDNVKKNLAKLLGLICPKIPEPFRHDIHRAALINFSGRVIEAFDFNTFTKTTDIQNAIKSQTYQGGMTHTNEAFDRALSIFTAQRGMRSNTHHEVLVLTDGQSNGGDYKPALARLKNAGVKVYALAIKITSDRGKREIEDYASEPKDEHLFALTDFRQLDTLLAKVEEELKSTPCQSFVP